MASETPEQAAAKAAKRAAKKARFGEANAQAGLPAVEMRVPARIDLDKPPWDSYLDALEANYRNNVWIASGKSFTGPVRRKLILT